MCYDNLEETQAKVSPIILKNLDASQYIHLPAKTVIVFARPEEENEVAYVEIAEIENSAESVEDQCRNWLPKKKPKTDFIISPADIDEHPQVNVRKGQCSKEAINKLDDILRNFDDIISKSSSNIGTTSLISMDIDTGDSPPVSQRPYTLPKFPHSVPTVNYNYYALAMTLTLVLKLDLNIVVTY